MKLRLIEGDFAVCRLGTEAAWAVPSEAGFVSVTRTPDELSVVCSVSQVPAGAIEVETGWRLVRVVGQLPFDAVGVLNSLTAPLAVAGISVFAQSTFDTDYLMVKADKLDATVHALTSAGFGFC